MLDRLLRGHRELEAIADRLRTLLDAEIPDIERLKTVRWEFATKLMQHLTLEDRHVYANLAASPYPEKAAIGRRYQSEYASHLTSYAAHAQHWTTDRVIARWSSYRIATKEQLKLLHERICMVERELYPLVRNSVQIDQPRAPSRSWAREAFALKESVAPQRETGRCFPEGRR